MITEEVKQRMQKAIENMKQRFTTVRAGRANPALVSDLKVQYYGVDTPLQQLATISIPEARQLSIKPFDRSCLKDIEKAIFEANIGLTPTNNGEIIIITIPELTEERRRDYVKQAKSIAEEAKIALRNIRQDANKDVKNQELAEDEEKRTMDRIQELTNDFNKQVDELLKEKEKELMSV